MGKQLSNEIKQQCLNAIGSSDLRSRVAAILGGKKEAKRLSKPDVTATKAYINDKVSEKAARDEFYAALNEASKTPERPPRKPGQEGQRPRNRQPQAAAPSKTVQQQISAMDAATIAKLLQSLPLVLVIAAVALLPANVFAGAFVGVAGLTTLFTALMATNLFSKVVTFASMDEHDQYLNQNHKPRETLVMGYRWLGGARGNDGKLLAMHIVTLPQVLVDAFNREGVACRIAVNFLTKENFHYVKCIAAYRGCEGISNMEGMKAGTDSTTMAQLNQNLVSWAKNNKTQNVPFFYPHSPRGYTARISTTTISAATKLEYSGFSVDATITTAANGQPIVVAITSDHRTILTATPENAIKGEFNQFALPEATSYYNLSLTDNQGQIVASNNKQQQTYDVSVDGELSASGEVQTISAEAGTFQTISTRNNGYVYGFWKNKAGQTTVVVQNTNILAIGKAQEQQQTSGQPATPAPAAKPLSASAQKNVAALLKATGATNATELAAILASQSQHGTNRADQIPQRVS